MQTKPKKTKRSKTRSRKAVPNKAYLRYHVLLIAGTAGAYYSGEFLKELDLIEERGTGVPTMLKSLSKNGSAPPTFKTDEARSFFEVKFDIHPAFIEDISHLDKEREPKKRRGRQEIREAILKILEEGAHSQSELRQMLGYSSISRTMTGVVNSLLKEGLVRYTTENERDPRAKLILTDAN